MKWFFVESFGGHFLDFLVEFEGSGANRKVLGFISSNFGPNPTPGSLGKGNHRGAILIIVIPDRER